MIFIDNKYTRWYYNIINRAKTREITGYTEKHHFIPKSFFISKSKTGWLDGDSEIPDNKVNLTKREHFICHLLLVKMTTGHAKTKMSFSLMRFSKSKNIEGKINSRIYEYIKQLHSRAVSLTQKGIKEKTPMSKETREKISKAHLGKKLSEEHKFKLRKPKSEAHKNNMKGRIITLETRKKLSLSAIGRKVSDDTRFKQSVSAKNKLPVTDVTRKKLSESLKGKVCSEEHKKNLSIMQKNLPRLCCLHCGYEIDSRTFNRFHKDSCKKDSRL